MSHTRARKIVLNAFESIRLNKKGFGLQSLRAGGASTAANTNINYCFSSGASAISEGDIFIYSCSAQLISFEICLKDIAAGSLIKLKMG